MNRAHLLGVLAATLALAGCANWTRVKDSEMGAEGGSFRIEAPVGWVHAEFLNQRLRVVDQSRKPRRVDVDRIVLTRDGLDLERIEVCFFAHEDAFPRIGKQSTTGMLASELAELTVAELKSAQKGGNLEVTEIAPAVTAGEDGFRLQAQFKNERGLEFRVRAYGFANERGFYRLIYQAPRLHYYERHLDTFEALRRSLRLPATKSAGADAEMHLKTVRY